MKMKQLNVLIIILVSCFILTSCTPNMGKLTGLEYVTWTDIESRIEFSILKSGGAGYGTIYVNGTKRRALFQLRDTEWFYLSITLHDDSLSGYDLPREDIIIDYKNEEIYYMDTLTLFGVTYDKLLFTKSTVDKTQIDAADYLNISWSSVNNEISVHFSRQSLFKSQGVAKNKAGEMVDILFKWKEDRKFEIYLYENEILSSNPVVSGYYENDEKVAVLTLEYNVLFDENTTTITLLGDV